MLLILQNYYSRSKSLLPVQNTLSSQVAFTLDYIVLKPERNNVNELFCHASFQGSQALPACHSDQSIIMKTMSMEHW